MTRKKKNNSIGEILASISPQEAKRIENRMLIASKIDDAMKAKGWKKKDLMQSVGKNNPSEITRWLSGTHNFTIDTLTDLSLALNIDLLNLEDKQETVVQTYNVITVYAKSDNMNKSYASMMSNSQSYFKETAVLSN